MTAVIKGIYSCYTGNIVAILKIYLLYVGDSPNMDTLFKADDVGCLFWPYVFGEIEKINMAMPNLPDEIITKILEILGEEVAWHLGQFIRVGNRTYALVHQI